MFLSNGMEWLAVQTRSVKGHAHVCIHKYMLVHVHMSLKLLTHTCNECVPSNACPHCGLDSLVNLV